jgi:hypothetical protein
LTGPIPKKIRKLTALTRLELYSNKLDGTIPKQIKKLVALRFLYLENNELSGRIPPQIVKKLDHLEACSVQNNPELCRGEKVTLCEKDFIPGILSRSFIIQIVCTADDENTSSCGSSDEDEDEDEDEDGNKKACKTKTTTQAPIDTNKQDPAQLVTGLIQSVCEEGKSKVETTDILFLVDSSTSMCPYSAAVAEGMAKFVTQLEASDVDSRYAVASFGGLPTVLQKFSV